MCHKEYPQDLMIVISLFIDKKKKLIIAANSTSEGAISPRKSGIIKNAIAIIAENGTCELLDLSITSRRFIKKIKIQNANKI